MSDDFAGPGSSVGLDYDEMKGHLLLIEPLLFEPSIATTFGDNPAMRCNVVDLSTGDAYEDTLVFPKMLVSSLRSRVGAKVLGTLGQGQVRKPGQNAPWILIDASGDQQAVAAAKAWIAKVGNKQFSAPAASAGSDAAASAAANKANLTSIFGASEVAPPF